MHKPVEEKVEATTGAAAEVLTFGDELSNSERKEIWDNGGRLLNWTLELLRLREAKAVEDWQAVLQRQKAGTPNLAAETLRWFCLTEFLTQHPEMEHATQMLLAYWPIEPPTSEEKIKFMQPRGKPHGSQFAQPYADAKFIRQQWQRVFHRERRHAYPTMYDAAAAYHGVGAEQLLNYGRNHNRTSRRKIVR